MKFSFPFLTFICMVQIAMAQKGLPAFGKIELSDLELKDCSFDPGSDACKLIDWGNMYFTRKANDLAFFTTMYERRVRIKILKPAGLSYANVTIPFYSNNNDEKIIKMDACTYNIMDGRRIKKTTIYKNGFYNRRINKQYSELIIVFPEVKVGSVIEYKYIMARKTIADIKDWYFQSNIPTRYSGYQVSIPSLFHFTIQPLTADSLEMKETNYTDRLIVKSGTVSWTVIQKNFNMHNLPAIRNEPYMGSARDYLQRLSFRLSGIDYGNGNEVNTPGDWYDVAGELINDADFGRQINRNPTASSGMILAANQVQGLENRMEFVYNYVKKKMHWDGRETIYSFEGIKKAFQKQSGSSADINLLLVSLLNQAGVPALPVLFSTRDNGLVNTALPFINQFNTVMALVEDKKKYYVLDATDKYASYHLIPVKVINTKGFIVEQGNGRWLDAIDTIHKYKVITAVRGEIDSSGTMKGDVLITSSGYARKQRYEDWMEDKDKYAAGYLTGEYNGLQIDATGMENPETDTLPLEQKLRFSMALSNSGEHRYFKMNLFSGLEKNQFPATERRTDIEFCYPQEYTIYGNYTIPFDYIFEELPQNISLIMPDTSIIFKRFISAENNSLNVRMSVDFRRSWYAAGEYPGFADFYKILLSKLNEPVIIKKKDQL
ncbi:MAG: DUF3857 domain-containing protein [Ferruginibacter sp.]